MFTSCLADLSCSPAASPAWLRQAWSSRHAVRTAGLPGWLVACASGIGQKPLSMHATYLSHWRLHCKPTWCVCVHGLPQVTVDLKLSLPQVAVVGSQSSGKSSVLEALVRHDELTSVSG